MTDSEPITRYVGHKMSLGEIELLQSAEEIRPEVFSFALEMEKVLRDYDYRGGWQESPIPFLMTRLLEEVVELNEYVIYFYKNSKKGNFLQKQCVDVANFAMMIHNNITRSL